MCVGTIFFCVNEQQSEDGNHEDRQSKNSVLKFRETYSRVWWDVPVGGLGIELCEPTGECEHGLGAEDNLIRVSYRLRIREGSGRGWIWSTRV